MAVEDVMLGGIWEFETVGRRVSGPARMVSCFD